MKEKNNNVKKENENKKIKKIKVKEEDTPKIQAIKFTILAVVAIVIFSMAMCPVTMQNDTYYTIKIGEHIVNTGTVDMQDPFSWNEGLPYTYPHWLYDVIVYLIYSFSGFTGIFISTLILSAILGTVMYFTNLKISKSKLLSFLITIGAMYLIRHFICARAQLVTFILLELTILFIENFLTKEKKKKIKYAVGLILISILIANIHSAVWPFFFVLFLPYIAEYLIFKLIDTNLVYKIRKAYYKHKINSDNKTLAYCKGKSEKYLEKYRLKISKTENKIENLETKNVKVLANREEKRKKPYRIKFYKNPAVKWLIVIVVICAFTGLLTPLKGTPYTYLYKTMIGNTTKNINEHLPLTLINNKEIMVVLAAFALILVFTDTKIRLKDLFMITGLTLLMFMTRRQVSMFVIFGSAIFARLIMDIFEKYDKGGASEFEKIMTSTLGLIATLLVITLISALEIKSKVGNEYVSTSDYPVEASEYIKNNIDLSTMKLYNEYNYGSYLLFKDIPVFIDSRADLYAPEFNGTKDSSGKYVGRDIFSDYINTSSINTYYETTFDKYNITHVILYKNAKLNMFLSKDSNYNQLYSDDSFVIYERLNVKKANIESE